MKNSRIKLIITVLCVTLISATSFFGGYTVKKIDEDKNEKYHSKTTTASYEYSIDIEEEKCLSKVFSTADMSSCINSAEEKWQKEINKYLKKLEKSLPPAEYKNIKENQESWLISDKQNRILINKYIYEKDGTMFINIGDNENLMLTKNRAVFLKSLYDYYNYE